jgi:hypothetical protein
MRLRAETNRDNFIPYVSRQSFMNDIYLLCFNTHVIYDSFSTQLFFGECADMLVEISEFLLFKRRKRELWLEKQIEKQLKNQIIEESVIKRLSKCYGSLDIKSKKEDENGDFDLSNDINFHILDGFDIYGPENERKHKLSGKNKREKEYTEKKLSSKIKFTSKNINSINFFKPNLKIKFITPSISSQENKIQNKIISSENSIPNKKKIIFTVRSNKHCSGDDV